MSGRQIQDTVFAQLRTYLGPDLVVREWSVRRQAKDTFGDIAAYAPRLDIGIGPFNSSFQNRFEDSDTIRRFDSPFVRRLRNIIREQNPYFYENPNPRCLIGIEVEHSTSSKHILGGITNASLLGLLGVVIGSPQYITKIRRIHAYVRKLREVEKARGDMFGNIACLEQGEFLELLVGASH